ncbi:MAG: rRNA cytosine-C5-methyltransferase [Muribaculaceae bacterium]|nr:rRNA cytosine-C5-methyltransferase [Muribaculaceae bacterium]
MIFGFFVTFVAMNLSQAFIEQLRGLLPAEWEALAQAITSSEPSVAVRVNEARGATAPADARLVPWCGKGFYLQDRPTFTFDTDWHAGRYYVQDASSMFIAHVIRSLIHEPVRYLDLCAAPGGKTTAALQALLPRSLVVANEIIPPRARVLADNVIRWGNPRSVVTSNAPAHLGKMTHFFDVIAADVPCSGEGMMRKDDEAVAQWSPALVEQCAQRQREILTDVWPALRPGGLLIYSTCTYNRQENEEMADFIVNELGATSLEVPIEPDWNIHPAIGSDCDCYRFMPHRVDGEGLFMAAFRKQGNAPRQDIRFKEKSAKKTDATGLDWLSCPDDYVMDQQGDLLIAVPQDIRREVAALRSSLNVLHAGVELASIMGRKTVPHHALAMSTERAADAFPVCAVDYMSALRYLRGESITVDAPRGYILIAHEGAILGFANNLGNRANNLYPKSQRILSTHLPDTRPTVLTAF